MVSLLSNLSAEQFEAISKEEMTLLHHITFDGKQEALKAMISLPYFSEIVDSDNNEVRVFSD